LPAPAYAARPREAAFTAKRFLEDIGFKHAVEAVRAALVAVGGWRPDRSLQSRWRAL